MISYKKLQEIVANIKPYRNTDEYPYASRTHRHKYFKVVEVDGKIEYHLYYWGGFVEDYLDPYEAEQMKEHDPEKFDKYHSALGYRWKNMANIPYYSTWNHDKKPIFIVRDDNTAELTHNSLHQGSNMIWSQYLPHRVFAMKSSRAGGNIIKSYVHNLKIPVFKGFRYNIDTFELHESSRYSIDIPYVDRTKSNEVIKAEKEKLNIIKTFMNTLDNKSFADTVRDVFNEYVSNDNADNYHSEVILNKADELWQTDYVSASYLYMIGFGIHDMYWIASNNNPSRYKPIIYFEFFKRKFSDRLKTLHNTFTKVKYWDFDKNYPDSRWGIEVRDTKGNILVQLQ